jgi:hypothetical protein
MKISMSYHSTPARRTIRKKKTMIGAGKGVEKLEALCIVGRNIK